MQLVMCMAGRNTRFHDAGFDLPKYLLPWENGVILDGILNGLDSRRAFSRVIYLPNQRDSYFRKNLAEVVARHGGSDEDIIYVPDTRGQAHTAAIGAQIISEHQVYKDEPIAFHNGDTILRGRRLTELNESLQKRHVFVDVFPASSPRYSYVLLEGSQVKRIAEKVAISPFASSGFYAFQNAQKYLRAFNDQFSAHGAEDVGELYISRVIQHILDEGGDVFSNEIAHGTETIVLGSPTEYGLEMARSALSL